MKSGTSN